MKKSNLELLEISFSKQEKVDRRREKINSGKVFKETWEKMKTIKQLAIEQSYEKTEQDFLLRGLATPEEIERSKKNRELSERFGIEISN